jgi:hypothetical protein
MVLRGLVYGTTSTEQGNTGNFQGGSPGLVFLRMWFFCISVES